MGIASIVLALATAISLSIASVVHVHGAFASDARTYEDFFRDVRAMNEYNSYYVAAIVIFLGFALDGKILSEQALLLLLAGFLAGSVSIFFYPIRKPKKSEPTSRVKAFWLFKVLATQWTIVLTVFGITTVVAETLANGQVGR
jgi:hypothetical protein